MRDGGIELLQRPLRTGIGVGKLNALQPLFEGHKTLRLRNALEWLLQQAGGFLGTTAGNQQAHVVKARVVVGGVGGHGFGQFLQGCVGVSGLHQLLGFFGLGLGVQGIFTGQVLVQEGAHLAFGLCTHKAIDRAATDHQDAGGHAADAKHGGNLLVGVHIDLGQSETACVVGLQLLQRGHQGFAWATPGGPKIHQHRRLHGGGNHLGFKIF